MTTIDWQRITTNDVMEAFGAAGIRLDTEAAADCLDALLDNAERLDRVGYWVMDAYLPVSITIQQAHLIASYLATRPTH